MQAPSNESESHGTTGGKSSPKLGLVAVLAAFLGAALTALLYLALAPEDDGISVRPTPSVVVALQDLSRLETTRYHMERLIDLKEKQSRFQGLLEAEDAIRMQAVGDVTAGVDLSKISEGDIVIDETRSSATITLPKPEILDASLDNERTVVFERDTDLLARRNEGLETRARQEAERTIREAALEAGILDRAEKGAASTIRSLVISLGYENVEIRFR